MNIAYIYVDVTRICGTSVAPYIIDFEVYQYEKDTILLDDDKIEDVFTFQFSPQRLANVIKLEGYPLHQIYHPLKNRIYKFRVKAGYFYPNNEEGGNLFYSDEIQAIIDNRKIIVCNEKIKRFFTGVFRDRLERDKVIDFYYGYEYNENWKIGDILAFEGTTILKEITNIEQRDNQAPEFFFNPPDYTIIRAFSKIFRDRDFNGAVAEYFEGDIPEVDGILFIKIMVNSEEYFIRVIGNIKLLTRAFEPFDFPIQG
jgi:hypothetical protein